MELIEAAAAHPRDTTQPRPSPNQLLVNMMPKVGAGSMAVWTMNKEVLKGKWKMGEKEQQLMTLRMEKLPQPNPSATFGATKIFRSRNINSQSLKTLPNTILLPRVFPDY